MKDINIRTPKLPNIKKLLRFIV